MKKSKIILSVLVLIILTSALVVIYLLNFDTDNGSGYRLMPSISCEGNPYWYMVEYGVYPDDTLAFLLIQKAKHGNPITGQADRSGGENSLTGKVTTTVKFSLNGSIPLPNEEYTIYENLCTGLHSAKITDKSKAKIPITIITSFFNTEKRGNYDLNELLKFYESQKTQDSPIK